VIVLLAGTSLSRGGDENGFGREKAHLKKRPVEFLFPVLSRSRGVVSSQKVKDSCLQKGETSRYREEDSFFKQNGREKGMKRKRETI